MALPSSPPTFPDIEEEVDFPSSPPLLPTSSALPVLPTRKRPLPDYENNNLSSDPLFSEEPSEADQTEYEGPKRKRMVKGPWWTLRRKSSRQPRPSPRAKDDFRNADSGVWLGSDESIDSIDSVLGNARDRDVADRIPTSSAVQPPSLSEGERIATGIISGCIDAGREMVDLSGLNLDRISSETLKPLHQLIRQSHPTLTEPPSEDEFVALTPSIKLFLSRNKLRTLPSELFRLDNVAVLSLRGNELQELPHSIARLGKLQELNIAGNNIRWLPWELKRFLECQREDNRIIVRPNPLIEPTKIDGPLGRPGRADDNEDDLSQLGDMREYIEELRTSYLEHGPLDIRTQMELRLKLGRLPRIQYLQAASKAGREVNRGLEVLIYLASSSIRWFGVDGAPLRRSGQDQSSYPATLDPFTDAPEVVASSLAPSLFELASRAAQKGYNLQELLLLPDIPPTVRVAFEALARGIEFGNQACSTCSRTFIVARAEWIEYWHYGPPSQTELRQENILPFMRRVCSWRCAIPTETGELRC